MLPPSPRRDRFRGLLLRATRCLLAGLAAGALVSCRPATQVTLELGTDAECVDIRQTSITTGRLEGLEERPAVTSTSACDPETRRIGSLAVVPRGADDAELGVRVGWLA